MQSSLYNLVVNFAVVIIWVAVALLVVQRIMETREFKYLVEKTETGIIFTYRLGIYAGRVTLSRKWGVDYPRVSRKADGWEILFPPVYTDREITNYMKTLHPDDNKNKSHIKDLEIFRQVVIRNNHGLECIRGQVFTEDRRKHPR